MKTFILLKAKNIVAKNNGFADWENIENCEMSEAERNELKSTLIDEIASVFSNIFIDSNELLPENNDKMPIILRFQNNTVYIGYYFADSFVCEHDWSGCWGNVIGWRPVIFL